jgi:hypothetical protein
MILIKENQIITTGTLSYVVSKRGRTDEWNLNGLAGKMYALPYKMNDTTVFPDILGNTCNWFVTPIHHTLL